MNSPSWVPANPHIPVTITKTVKDGKEITTETFADGRKTITERPAPKYVSIDLEDYQ